MADAEAITEAASRLIMQLVTVMTEDQQAAIMAYRVRDILVQQNTQTTNARRAHFVARSTVLHS
jgi:transposase